MLPLSLSLRRFRAFEEEWVGSMIPNVNMPKCYEQNNISSEMIPLTESANRNNTHSRTGVAPRKMVYRGITQFCPDERGLDRPPCLNSTATRMRGSLSSGGTAASARYPPRSYETIVDKNARCSLQAAKRGTSTRRHY